MILCKTCNAPMYCMETRQSKQYSTPDSQVVRRRYRCAFCDTRVSTVELLIDDYKALVKRGNFVEAPDTVL